MAEFDEVLTKIREMADQYHSSGQMEAWADAENDFALYEQWFNGGANGSCPVNISKYTGMVEQDAEATIEQTTDYAAVMETPVVEVRRDDIKIQRLMTDALAKLGREEFDEAEKLIKDALELDPSDQEVRDTLNLILKTRVEKIRKSLVYTLRFGNDIGPLKSAIDAANNELKSNPDDAELAELWENGKVRFENLRNEQGQFTTNDALKEYKFVIEGIKKMGDIRDAGGTTFYEERTKTIKPVEDILKEYTASVNDLVKDLISRKMAHVENYLPEEGLRNPKSALDVLQECLTLEGIEDATQKEIEARIRKVRDEVNLWEKADAQLKKAEDPQLNDYEKFQFFQNAKNVYPYHSDVIGHEKDYSLKASVFLTEVLENALAKNENLLQREAKMAVDQRISGEGEKPLPFFEEARREIQELVIKANRISKEFATSRLGKAKEKAADFISRLEQVENRRKEIRSIFLRISDENKRNAQIAIDSIEGLESGILDDPEIKYLRKVLDLNLNAGAHVKIAKKHYESRKYRDCIDELSQIVDSGELEEEIYLLLENAELRLAQEQILDCWARKNFAEGYEKINTILKDKFVNTDLVNEIIQESKLNEKKVDYHKRLEVDEGNRLLEQKTQLRKDWDQLKSEELTDQNLFDWVEKAIKLLQSVSEISRLPSTQEGWWIGWVNEIKSLIHDRSFEILHKIEIPENRQQVTNLFRIIQRLQQYLLVENQQDRLRRRDICLAYFSSIQRDLERGESWAEIIRNWEEAYIEFGEPAFWDKLHASRFEAVKNVVMNALRKFDFDKAIRMSKLEELPFAFDPETQTPFTVEEENVLMQLARQGELMRTAHGLFDQKDYITMSDTLAAGIKNGEPKVLADYKRELTNQAIHLLSEEGDRVVKNDFAEGVMCFSTILRLDPENVLARGRIDSYRDNVFAEIVRIRTEGDGVNQQADIDVQLKQNHDRSLTLQSLMASLAWLDSKNSKDRKYLKDAAEENAQTRTALENAKKIMDDLSDDSPVWKGILRRCDWTLARTKITDLSMILMSHPSLQVLENRLRNAVDTSRRRTEFKKILQDAYLADDFETFETNFQTLITELFSESAGKEIPSDPYGLFPEDLTFFDPFIKKDVPFYHKTGEEFCVKCIVDQRIPNKKAYDKYAGNVAEDCRMLNSTNGMLTDKSDSYNTLQECQAFDKLCDKKWGEFIKPEEDPLSKTAKGLFLKAEEEIAEGKRHQEAIRKRIVIIEQMHKQFQAAMPEIVNLVNMHQFSQAQQKLLPLRDFYAEGSNDFNIFIEQTLRICSSVPESKRGLFNRNGR